jgi:hypothetical protein
MSDTPRRDLHVMGASSPDDDRAEVRIVAAMGENGSGFRRDDDPGVASISAAAGAAGMTIERG